jgi:AhpD family alkylhydroperoxidase
MSKSEATKQTAPCRIFSPAVAELVAIGAAVGANCETCFKYHYSQGHKLGLSREDMIQAVALADKVKRAPAKNMLNLADKLLRCNLSEQTAEPPPAACCGAEAPKTPRRKCC